MAERDFHYRSVSSTPVPGFNIENVGDDVVSPTQTPFRDGYLEDFSRVVTSNKSSKSFPRLIQVSASQKRAFELRYGEPGSLFWADEYDNMYGVLQLKGGNVTNPSVLLESRAPSGFVIYGLQESVSIKRSLRASKIMRQAGIETETIVRLTEPSRLPFKGENVSIDRFKHKLITSVWDENKVKAEPTDLGWRTVGRQDVPKLTKELTDMTFYISTVARQVSERFDDLNSVNSKEDFQKIMSRVFTFYNAKSKWLDRKNGTKSRMFDAENQKDINDYFGDILPKKIAHNYALLHNLGLKHVHSHLGNVSLSGGIYDLDSVYGEALHIDDSKVNEEDFREDIKMLIKGIDSHGQNAGIANLLSHLSLWGRVGSHVVKEFQSNFLVQYFKDRGWNASRNFREIYKTSEEAGITITNLSPYDPLRKALGERKYYYLAKRLQFENYRHPIVINISNSPLYPSNQTANNIENKPNKEKGEIIEYYNTLLDAHSRHIETHKASASAYFKYPKINAELSDLHSNMLKFDSRLLSQLWIDGELDEVSASYPHRAVGSFMLTFGQLNSKEIAVTIGSNQFDTEKPEFVKKSVKICELYEMLPPGFMDNKDFTQYFELRTGKRRELKDLEEEVSKRAALALFKYGIITRDFTQIFNQHFIQIILNEFTNEHKDALTQAIASPDKIDPVMANYARHLLGVALTGVIVREGGTDIPKVYPTGIKNDYHDYPALQYFFASTPQSEITDPHIVSLLEYVQGEKDASNCIEYIIRGKKTLHPDSYLAEHIKNSVITAEEYCEVIKTAVDCCEGDLSRLDPVLANLLIEKNYEGKISQEKATRLTLACIAFGVDLPDLIVPVMSQNRNAEVFRNFLSYNNTFSKLSSRRESAIYNYFSDYPKNPYFKLFSEGLEVIPDKIKDLFINNPDKKTGNLFVENLTDKLFSFRGYFYEYYNFSDKSDEWYMPQRDIRKHLSGLVHPSIWEAICTVDKDRLRRFFAKFAKKKTVMISKNFSLNASNGSSLYFVSLNRCIPRDIYEKLYDTDKKQAENKSSEEKCPNCGLVHNYS